jgi:hypothetical protein
MLAELRTSLLSLYAAADSPEALLLRHLLLLGAAALVAGVLGRLQICGVGLAVSYGPPWAHYLGGYQDRLLGGPLGLPDLCCTVPDGVKHKDYRGEVLG